MPVLSTACLGGRHIAACGTHRAAGLFTMGGLTVPQAAANERVRAITVYKTSEQNS
jgi:hypothetical protein